MKIFTRKLGIWICVMGIVILLLNLLTYSLWKIDIDILGAMIFVLGLVIVIAGGKSMKNSSGLLSRKNGIWLCVIAEAIILITGYMPFVNADIGGIVGLGVFFLGLILIAVGWRK